MAMASIVVIVFAAMGWCGGACAPAGIGGAPGAAFGDPSGGAGAGAAAGAAAGGAAAGGFTATAGVGGGGNGDGRNGRSPGASLSDLGLTKMSTYGFRGEYRTPDIGVNLRFAADYLNVSFAGSKDSYDGAPNPFIPVGAAVDSKLNINIWALTADYDVGPRLVSSDLGLFFGPRVQWVTYSDTLKYSTFVGEVSGTKSFGMVGFGFAGAIDLGIMSGRSGMTASLGRVLPRINVAGTIGKGGGMRYSSLELFINLFQTAGARTTSFGFNTPKMKASLGYIWYRFNETVDQDAVVGTTRNPGNAEYSLGVPLVSFSATF